MALSKIVKKPLLKITKKPPPSRRFYVVIYRSSNSKIVKVGGPYDKILAYQIKEEIENEADCIFYTKIKETKNFNGRWCQEIKGRIPFPIECQWNRKLSKGNACRTCERSVDWQAWKDGVWDKVKYQVMQGKDLTKKEPPKK